MLKAVFIKIIIILFILQTSINSFGRGVEKTLPELWIKYGNEKDNAKKESLLFLIGDMYLSGHEPAKRDSVFDLALSAMQIEGSGAQQMNIYKWYFSKEYAYTVTNATDIAHRMEVIANNNNNDEWLYYTYLAFYNIYFEEDKPEIALNYIVKANYYANIINNEKFKTESLLGLGLCQERTNNKIDAFRSFRDALYIANKISNDTLMYACYGDLSRFFLVIKNYEKAKDYKNKQFAMLIKQSPIDSPKLIQLYEDLSNILFENKEYAQAKNIVNQIINYSYEHHDEELKSAAFDIYRGYLIGNGLLTELANIYTKKYPDELMRISQSKPAFYYRLKAYIEEAGNKPDSAQYYLQLSENNISKESHDNIFIANFYRRFGQFLLRTGKRDLAKTKFEASYHYALQARYFPYIIDASWYLDSINLKEGNFEAAYTYEKQNRLYTDSEAMASRQNELLLLEIDNENRLQELNMLKAKAQTERRHNIQDIGILIFISVLFIVLVMLGSFRVPKTVIKSVGFISFILLFEFIVMITDTKVENYTMGEPWKILLFKLIIISLLAPIHHKLEHLLLEYLYEHKLVDTAKMKLRPLIARILKKKEIEEHHKEMEERREH